MRQEDVAEHSVLRRIIPSPIGEKESERLPRLPPRLMRTTPENPSKQPATFLPVSRSCRNASAESRMAKKLALASMTELVVPAA
jgi:hypothetical protein